MATFLKTISISLFFGSAIFSTLFQDSEFAHRDRYLLSGELERTIGNFPCSVGKAQQLIANGNAHFIKARYLEAIRCFRQAERLASSAGDRETEALAWAYIGQFYWRIGNREAGELYLNDALRVLEGSSEKLGYALALRFMGRLENGRERVGRDMTANLKAIKLYEKSISICREIGNVECEVTAQKDLGQAYINHDYTPESFALARRYLEDALTRIKGTEHRWLYAVVLNNLATAALRQNDLANANKFADEAIEIFRKMDDRQELREMLYTKSLIIFAEKRDIERAEPFINAGVQIARDLYSNAYGDNIARQRYFESIVFGFHARESYFHHLKRFDKVLETLESSRSWALQEALAKRDLTARYTPEEIDADRKMRAELPVSSIGKESLLRKRLLYEEWKAELDATYRRGEPTTAGTELTVSQMCSALPDNKTAILRFHAVKYSPVSLFILTKANIDTSGFKDELPTKDLFTKQFVMADGTTCSMVSYYASRWDTPEQEIYTNDIHKRILEFHSQITTVSPGFKENARILYRQLLAPAAKIVPSADHFVFVAGGNLTRVPFQALVDEYGKFLIESRSVSYAPSISTLLKMQQRKLSGAAANDASFLGLGAPAYAKNGPVPLPETAIEIADAARGFKRPMVFTRANATLENWRKNAAGKRTIHFALHGSSDTAQPMYSYLALTPTKDSDGILTASEIAGMRLDADLVVLSACETAYGKEIDGEGIVGLTWAFAAAGVPTIVSTNWRIDSKTTQELIRDFYAASRNGSDAVASMRTATLARIKNRDTYHPFYWAGFSVNGTRG